MNMPDSDPIHDNPRDTRNLHRLWPNYDLRDIGIPDSQNDAWASERDKRLFVVRSTILDTLEEEHVKEDLQGETLPEHLQGRELRRLGLAARGKFEVFHIAKKLGSTLATFNIGTISHPKDRSLRLDLGNKPSQEHNRWATPTAWRQKYYDVLIPSPDMQRLVAMYWKAYDGRIDDGIRMIEGPGGIFERKGYSLPRCLASVEKNFALLDCDIHLANHAPWKEMDMPVSA